MARVGTDDADGSVIELTRKKTARPPKYLVVMFNDDYTPAEFVVGILKDVFRMDEMTAITTMLAVHQRGAAACGAYSRDVAETKLDQAKSRSAAAGHALKMEMQPE